MKLLIAIPATLLFIVVVAIGSQQAVAAGKDTAYKSEKAGTEAVDSLSGKPISAR
jgi:hypothetical protein